MQLGFGKKLPPVAQRVPPSKLPLLRAAIAKSGLPEKVLDQMDTWLAAISLLGVQFSELGLKGAHGPEEVLRQQFLASHKPIGELESNVEQFGFFDRLPESAQRALLEGAIEPAGMAKHGIRPDAGAVDAAATSRGSARHSMPSSPARRH